MTGTHRNDQRRTSWAGPIAAVVVTAAAILGGTAMIMQLSSHDTRSSSAGQPGPGAAPFSPGASDAAAASAHQVTGLIAAAASSVTRADAGSNDGSNAGAPPASSAAGSTPAGSTSSEASTSSTTPLAPLTYTVKPGDNLSAIAAWFHLHGYGPLYEANKATIGDNPALIHPGQIITISSTGVTIG